MNPNRLAAIIVIYNRHIEDSPSCMKLFDYANISKFIIDNSDKSHIIDHNRDYCLRKSLDYSNFKENLGLSKAYNIGFRKISDTCKDIQWIMVFDHDTTITDQYLQNVISHTLELSCLKPTVLYPIVKTSTKNGETVISPHAVFPRKTSELYINSGIVYSRYIVDKERFDERLFLDLVDYDFMLTLRHRYLLQIKEIPLLAILYQDFSGSSFSSMVNDQFRFELYTKDSLYFARKWKFVRRSTLMKLIKRGIHLALHYNSYKFFEILKYYYKNSKNEVVNEN